MAVESTPAPNGLKTAWDTIVAPNEAFEALSAAPTWGWALLVSIVLITVSSYLLTPAIIHGMTTDWPNMVARSAQLSAQSPEQQQAGLAVATKFVTFNWIFAPFAALIAALLGAVILLIFNAVGHGQGSFAKYWAAQWNISIITGVGSLVLAIIVLARGPGSFSSTQAVQAAMPSLAMFVPATSVKLHAFLSVFTIFGIWATGLEIAALAIIGRVGRVTAWLGGSLTLIFGGIIVAAFAR